MSELFKTIVADPPWPYKSPGKIGGDAHPTKERTEFYGDAGSRVRYGAMSIDDICTIDVRAADDAHLYLWFTNGFAVEAHKVAEAWGFRPVTILTWTKVKPDGTPSMKMGYYFRGATEHVLFGVRGSLRLRAGRAVPTAFFWPRTPHSVKPDAFYDLVEECSPGPYLELFARRQRIGWHCEGNELVA